MEYKIIQLDNLPLLVKKIICSFTEGRTAQIRINNVIGPKFHLKSGVPQGSILSSSLFISFTHDLPQPVFVTDTDMIFADDISQIIENHDNDKEELAVQSEREIVRVNEYEKLWKIKTNATKFKMISVSKTQPYPIGVNGNIMPFTNYINLLGLTLTRAGFVKHIYNCYVPALAPEADVLLY